MVTALKSPRWFRRVAVCICLAAMMSLLAPATADPTPTRAELVDSAHVVLLPEVVTSIEVANIDGLPIYVNRWWTIVIAQEDGGWRFLVERSFPQLNPGCCGTGTIDPEIHVSQDAESVLVMDPGAVIFESLGSNATTTVNVNLPKTGHLSFTVSTYGLVNAIAGCDGQGEVKNRTYIHGGIWGNFCSEKSNYIGTVPIPEGTLGGEPIHDAPDDYLMMLYGVSGWFQILHV